MKFWLFLIFFIILIVNFIFLYNRTVHIVLGTLFILLFFCCVLFFYELEFFALSYGIIYAGGILIMFLFFVIVVSTSNEQQKLVLADTKHLLIKSIFYLILSLLLVYILLSNYDYNAFNYINYFWNDWFVMSNLKKLFYIIGELYDIYSSIDTDGLRDLEEIVDFYTWLLSSIEDVDGLFVPVNFLLTEINFFNLSSLSEIYILSIEFLKEFWELVLLIGFSLTIATISAISISTSVLISKKKW